MSSIQFDDTIIRNVPFAKYLGVTLDEKLDWKEHISILNKSLIKISNSFKIIKYQVPQSNKITLYYAYIFQKSSMELKSMVVLLAQYSKMYRHCKTKH